MTLPVYLVPCLAVVLAAAYSLREALDSAQYYRSSRAVVSVYLRRTLIRGTALALLAHGLVSLASYTAGVIWSDLDTFLLTPARLDTVAAIEWSRVFGLAVLGALLAAVAFPPGIGWTLGGALAVVALHGWWVVATLLPLAPGRVEWLAGPTVAVACLGVLQVVCGWWRGQQDRADTAVERVAWLSALAALALLGGLTACIGWLRARNAVPGALVTGLLVGLVVLAPRAGWRAWPATFEAMLRGQRSSLVRVASLAVLIHGLLALGALDRTLVRGEQRLDDLARWPHVATGSPAPTPPDWQRTAEQLTFLAYRYAAHPWAGRHLLLASWIEAEHLDQPTRARAVLAAAVQRYGRTRAVAPPGWPVGRTIGAIGGTLLDAVGHVTAPGRPPA